VLPERLVHQAHRLRIERYRDGAAGLGLIGMHLANLRVKSTCDHERPVTFAARNPVASETPPCLSGAPHAAD
jgi:hypothetical protein